MIAVLFVLIPGILAALLIRRPAQALIPLLIVALRLWFWKSESHRDLEAAAIYLAWFCNLACLLAARLHPRLGWGLWLWLTATTIRFLFMPVEMDCTGIVELQKKLALAGLLASAFAVFRPVRQPSARSPE